jgi:hypothetical protein
MNKLSSFCAAFLGLVLPLQCIAQSSATSGAAAGLAAGAALGASSSQSTSASSSAGGSSAPIEMNIMVYGAIKRVSSDMANKVAGAINAINAIKKTAPAAGACTSTGKVLLEDSTTVPLLSLHASWKAMVGSLFDELTSIQKRVDPNADQITALRKAATDAIEKAKNKPPEPAARRPALAVPQTAPAASTPTTTSTAAAPTTAATAFTYLGDIGTALGIYKSGLSYSASSVSPATQALTTALAHDLCAQHILLYTSASTINLEEASRKITRKIVDLQKINADIQLKATVDTTLPTVPDSVKTDPDVQKALETFTQFTKTNSPKITSDAATANQLMNTLLSWQTGSDGNGGLIITDIIRAEMLAKAMQEKIPALQVNIDAAGGSTRTNSYFFFNLFYTPKPSYNAGVVVTYELRDTNNIYIAGDTLKVLYDYTKWKPKCFEMSADEVGGTSLGTGEADKISIGGNEIKGTKQHIACQPQTTDFPTLK